MAGRRLISALRLALPLLLAATWSAPQIRAQNVAPQAPAPTQRAPSLDAPAWVQKNLVGWPPLTQKVALDLITKYGVPQESTARQLTWYRNGPWKRTVLLREGVPHNFPLPHQDVLEQTVDYRVPAEKVADLQSYDGSLVVDRTRGELSVHCDTEQANTLTLNLADDIVTGERSVEQAMAYHAQVVRGVSIGEPESYPQKLKFRSGAHEHSADAGEEAPLLRHLGQ